MYKKIKKLLFLLLIFTIQLAAQPDSIKQHYLKKGDFEPQLEVLRSDFGQSKSIPKAVELACLVALSHYPSLKNTAIDFVYAKEKLNMSARPKLSFLFKKKAKRQYLIRMTDNQDAANGVILSNYSFNALVGIFGHELAHIVDYQSKSKGRLIADGFNYLRPKFVREYERATDKRAVKHGFAYQLYDRLHYVIYEIDLPPKIKEYTMKRRKNYLSLEELIQAISEK